MITPTSSSLQMKKLYPEALWPCRASSGAAGLDLFCATAALIPPGELKQVYTGIAVAIPRGMVGLVKPRSSAFRRGVDLDGTIDSDYRGELILQVRNASNETLAVNVGDRIAQLVIVPAPTVVIVTVDELDETVRGCGGFGSTGR